MAKQAKPKKKKKKGASDLKQSAQNVWFAGLGALAVADEEGGKLFKNLVARGREYQAALGSPLKKAKGHVETTVADVRTRAGETVARVETAFDHQIETALNRIGVPTRKEISALARRVERLTQRLDELKEAPVAATKTAKRATKKKAP